MAYSPELTSFAQSIYLTIKNRYFDDITGTDGQEFISQVVDFTNQYLDELESLSDSYARPVYWNFARTMGEELGSAVLDESTLDIDDTILHLVANPKRPVKIIKNGVTVSTWSVASPSQLNDDLSGRTVAKVGSTLYFSRAFNSSETGGTVTGDVVSSLPRLSASNGKVLSIVKPRQLLILGVAKNASLPDIVQGGLSPSFVQKYNDLLQQSILLNNSTATGEMTDRDDFAFVGGVGF